AILIAVTFLANSVLSRYSDSIQNLFHEDYDSAVACQSMKEALEGMVQRAQSTRPAPTPFSSDPNIPIFERKLALQSDITDLPGEREMTNRLRDAWEQFRALYVSLDDPARTESQKRDLVAAEILSRAAEIRAAAQKIIDMNLAYMESARGAARDVAQR